MKDKIVGKILILFLLVCSRVAAEVELKITDMEGDAVEHVEVGQHFMLELTEHGTQSIRHPHIEGLDAFEVEHRGTYSTIINNDITVMRKYKLRTTKAGSYSLGPVISEDGKEISSEVIQVSVGVENTANKDPVQQKTPATAALLSLKFDRTEAYVGQKVIASLSFLYGPSVELERLSEPEFNNFTIGSKTGPIEDSKLLNGVNYNLLTWRYELYPTKTGEHVIPASFADYLMPQKRDRFAGLSFFFGSRKVRKRTYSNAARLNIVPLPPYDSPVEAIGTFISYQAQIDPPVAKEGEGIVLRLTLEGDGNLDGISTPILQDMPASCKYYDSKAYKLDKAETGKMGKCFEYIVQVVEGGDFEIPTQEITYFDTKRQIYKTLRTTPLHVTIISLHPSAPKTVDVVVNDEIHEDAESASNSQPEPEQQSDALRSLDKNGAWYALPQRSMSWTWFFLLFALSCCYVGLHAARFLNSYVQDYYGAAFRRNRAFPFAKSQMRRLVRRGQLYTLFLELFAHRLEVPVSSVSNEKIEEVLNKVGFSADEIKEWNIFFTMCAAEVYSGQQTQDDAQVLFNQAKNWLKRLEKVL